jgi:hypothetical protein
VRKRVILILALSVVAALAADWLHGQQDEAAPEEVFLELSTRTYHIGPLLHNAPDRGFAATMDLYETSPSGNEVLAEESATDHLRALIELTVRSPRIEVWESCGGSATLDFYERSGTLLASQTAEGHARLSQLLQRLLSERLRTIFVTVRAVELDPAVRDDLLDRGSPIARTPEEQARLRAAVRQVYARLTLSGSNGQLLAGNAGRPAAYVAYAELSMVEPPKTSVEPQGGYIPNGLAVRMRPSLSAAGDLVHLSFVICHAQLRKVRQSGLQSSAGGDSAATQKIDLPTCDADQRAGTVVVPLKCPMLIGGSTVPRSLVTGRPEDTGTVDLDYLVTVRMTQTVPPPDAY